jgi:hypothetical protein
MVMLAKKAATLPEILDPAMMGVKDGKIYVLQRATIFIYSPKDYKLIKQFGREGEGPREFIVRPFGPPMSVLVYPDRLVINSNNKISYFKFDGEYITERPAPPNTVYCPMGEKYLGIGAAIKEGDAQPKLAFRIFDQDFKPTHMLYQTKIQVGNLRHIILPMEALHYLPVYKNKLYVVNSKKGFVIDCFDFNGKKLYSIEKKWEKVKLPSDYETKAKEWFKTDPVFKQIWPVIKPGLKFEEYYPPVKDMYIDSDIIYAFTYKQKNDRYECVLMDLKGKELERVYLPLPKSDYYTYYPLLYSIENNTHYMLAENEDEETWELHVETIRKK